MPVCCFADMALSFYTLIQGFSNISKKVWFLSWYWLFFFKNQTLHLKKKFVRNKLVVYFELSLYQKIFFKVKAFKAYALVHTDVQKSHTKSLKNHNNNTLIKKKWFNPLCSYWLYFYPWISVGDKITPWGQHKTDSSRKQHKK